MKILVVEDEPKTGDYLRQGLTEAGFVVDLARDGLDGLHLALTEAYDLAVSNYALTELRRPFQEQYARELARCRFGYVTCNGFTTGELDQAELEALLPAHAEHAPPVEPSNPRCTVVYWRPQ